MIRKLRAVTCASHRLSLPALRHVTHVLRIYDTLVLHAILVLTLVYMVSLMAFFGAGNTSTADLLMATLAEFFVVGGTRPLRSTKSHALPVRCAHRSWIIAPVVRSPVGW